MVQSASIFNSAWKSGMFTPW